MPSNPSPLLNLELMADGENLNAWGQILNALFKRLEESIAGAVAITVSGSVTLTSTDYVQNQHRYAMLVLTGTGGTVTVPATSKTYLVKNGCTGDVTFTHGSGTTVTVAAGKIKWVATDGTDFFTAEEEDYLLLTGGTLTGALTLSGAPTADLHAATKAYVDTFLSLGGGTMTDFIVLHAAPTDNNHPATKGYVDGLAFNAIDLPGQAGQAGKYITTDGSTSSWSFVDWSGIENTPTTIAGYGITDAYTQTESDARFNPLITYTTLSGDITATINRHYGADSSTAARTVTLPAHSENGVVILSDEDGNAATNNAVLSDGTDTWTINVNYGWIALVSKSGAWVIKARG